MASQPVQIGRYTVLAELAAGGMGAVYLARTSGPGGFEKLVALKCIHPHLANEREFVEMFLDEARIASRIAHPNVCGVFEVSEADGAYFLAMEYLFGESLAHVLQVVAADPEQRYSPRLQAYAARIAADAAEGLHAAHELRGDDGHPLEVVHRDVSPQNLFVTYDGSVRVVDFGIARAAGRLHQTSTGVLKGKLAYMAPEQLARLPIDRRADVWALGVTLWELLTCRRLFRRESEVDTLLAVTTDPIPTPASVREHIAPELDQIVMRALERDREKRYQTARELGRDLARFAARHGDPVGVAELGEWMVALFPTEHARKRAMLEQARAGASEVHPAPAMSGEWNAPQVQSITRVEPATQSEVSVELPTRRTGLFVAVALGAFLVVAGVGLLVIPWGGDAQPDRPPDTAVPLPSPNVLPVPSPPAPSVVPAAAGLATGSAPSVPSTATPPPSEEPRTPSTGRGHRSSSREPEHVATPIPAPTVPSPDPVHEPAPPAAPAAPGTVDVGTPGGWADIYENGRRLGRSPTRVELPAGHHTLELRPFGSALGIEISVDVPAGGRARVSRPVGAAPASP